MSMSDGFMRVHKSLQDAVAESSKLLATLDAPEHYEAMLDVLAVQQARIDNALHDLEAANRSRNRPEQSQ